MKGLYTQGIAILTERAIGLDELQALLPDHPFLRTIEAQEEWALGGPTAVIAYQPEVNGLLLIDTVDHPWPDSMGDPKTDPMVFGAWAMGQFGPFAFPNGLERATQQAWAWREAKHTVLNHRAFLRLRISYVLGAGPDAKILPPAYDPRHELEFLVPVAQRLLAHPAVIAYFNPNGEVVATGKAVTDSLSYHREHNLPPLELWSNVRLFNVTPEWMAMDTVGAAQLDLADHEAVFPKGSHSASDIAKFLRNTTLYVLSKGPTIRHNDTIDGPGGSRWQAKYFAEPLSVPPREVICWVPVGVAGLPAQVTERKPAPPPATEDKPKKAAWWQVWKRG
jgi:hypothetical protein